MRRGVSIASMAIGTLLVILAFLLNMGPIGLSVVGIVVGGLLILAAGFIGLRTSRMEYLAAIWGIYFGLTLAPLVVTTFGAPDDNATAPSVVVGICVVGLLMLTLVLIASHAKE